MKPVLLIVDDERATRSVLTQALEDDYEVYSAANTKTARDILGSEPVDILLTDLRLGGSENGMDLIDYTRKLPQTPTCIMMTAYGSRDTATEAKKHGAYYFLTKPLNLDEVELLLRQASHTRNLETRNRELTRQLHPTAGLQDMLGESPAMRATFERIRQVAPTNATVLIEGETGTGKELVARALHALSPRCNAKFVAVNCAALSPQLMESELFGHEKGSFTGALQRRIGRFEEANGGTLFLDEIGEMDIPTQVKLLRVLAERSIERVGSNTPIPVDVRIVAATNRHLQDMVHAGSFRQDLFQRLNVVNLHLPPLRERAGDIVLMANSFLRHFCEENHKAPMSLSRASLEKLRGFDWPGNVRQLRTAIEHAVVMCTGATITPRDLPDYLNLPSPSRLSPADSSPPNSIVSDFNLAALEKRTILAAICAAKGNRSVAAEMLGINRRTLQRKLSTYPEVTPPWLPNQQKNKTCDSIKP